MMVIDRPRHRCLRVTVALLATIGVRPDIWKALGTWRFDTKLLSVAARVRCRRGE